MLSTGSLSAFSASVAQAGLGMSLGTPPSGRVLPRGSLLDLSV
jgi:hypothetical protein